jgi:hypothetical protein
MTQAPRAGFHFVNWNGVWHILDHRTIKIKDGKLTLCALGVPNPERRQVSLISRNPYDFAMYARKFPELGGYLRGTCEECRVWADIAIEQGTKRMYLEMGG